MKDELKLLQRHFGSDVEYREPGDWFLIPRYPTPARCSPRLAAACFSLRAGYPGVEPYGFYMSTGLLFDTQGYATANTAVPPPFSGAWTFFSWSPDGWIGTGDLMSGSNLWGWARSFAARLLEGPQ
jgi:hypothetical protein